MRSSVIVAIVMLLKAHLKTSYGLSEEYVALELAQQSLLMPPCSKCAKFVIGKKSNVGDRPAVRKHERPLAWDSLPFATAPMVTSEDAAAQTTRVRSIPSNCLM